MSPSADQGRSRLRLVRFVPGDDLLDVGGNRTESATL